MLMGFSVQSALAVLVSVSDQGAKSGVLAMSSVLMSLRRTARTVLSSVAEMVSIGVLDEYRRARSARSVVDHRRLSIFSVMWCVPAA